MTLFAWSAVSKLDHRELKAEKWKTNIYSVQKGWVRMECQRHWPLLQEKHRAWRNSHEQVKSLWVRIRDWGNKENLVVGVFYRPHNQDKPTDKILLQLQMASCSQAFILLGDFSHPNICCKGSRASCRQSGKLLECSQDKFLRQALLTPPLEVMH